MARRVQKALYLLVRGQMMQFSPNLPLAYDSQGAEGPVSTCPWTNDAVLPQPPTRLGLYLYGSQGAEGLLYLPSVDRYDAVLPQPPTHRVFMARRVQKASCIYRPWTDDAVLPQPPTHQGLCFGLTLRWTPVGGRPCSSARRRRCPGLRAFLSSPPPARASVSSTTQSAHCPPANRTQRRPAAPSPPNRPALLAFPPPLPTGRTC
jgi:hypothetical protein